MTNDEINRLIEKLDDIVPKHPKGIWEKHQRAVVDEAIEALKNMPEVKIGHWIWTEERTDYRCSECGRRIETNRFEDPYERFKSCHCGAKMINPYDGDGRYRTE